MLFEGEYFNDKKWNGFGKVLNIKGNLIYQGTYFEDNYLDGIFYYGKKNITWLKGLDLLLNVIYMGKKYLKDLLLMEKDLKIRILI